MTEHHQILIVGGGTAGITIAARLRKEGPDLDVAIVEPSKKHYYQPLWTLVGGGVFSKEESERDQERLIPPGVRWIEDYVTELSPEGHSLKTKSGKQITYEYLVLVPGLQVDWHKVKGLTEAIGKDGVCSNYSFDYVEKTWEFIREFRGGTAVFTQPNTPVKCGGAPQKIAYLAEDYFRINGVRDKSEVVFASANPSIFSVKKYADTLNQVIQRKGIQARFRHDLKEVKAHSREAVFVNLDTNEEVSIKYDLLHVTPPMSAPDVVKSSSLADAAGWVDVDKATLQSKKFENVFACGDVSNLPTSKTGAAIRKQAPTLVSNLISSTKKQPLEARYDGYTSCPLVTGYKGLVLAEFDYDLNPQETFPFDQSKERYSMYLLKKHLLPVFYWEGMLKGKM